jgi:hypothetical protein
VVFTIPQRISLHYLLIRRWGESGSRCGLYGGAKTASAENTTPIPRTRDKEGYGNGFLREPEMKLCNYDKREA